MPWLAGLRSTTLAMAERARVAWLVSAVILLGVPLGAQQGGGVPGSDALVRSAESALASGRYREAFDAFAAAAYARPRDVSLYMGAAVAASMFGRLVDAQVWLERALRLEPRNPRISQLLGEVLHRQGRLDAALDIVDAGLRQSPDDAGLAQRAEAWRREIRAQGGFYENRAAHFSVLFEGPADQPTARAVIEILERAYVRIGATLLTYPSQPLIVVLYTGRQFHDVTRTQPWVGGMFDGRIKIPVGGALAHRAELQRVAEHEFVHAAVATIAGPAGPAWLHEGLAVVLESGNGAWTHEVLAQTRTRPTLAALTRGFSGLEAEQARLAYARSASAVERLVATAGMPAVVSLLRSLGRGAPFESAFRQATARSLDEFERSLP